MTNVFGCQHLWESFECDMYRWNLEKWISRRVCM
jgi:hypothetical protein